MNIGEEKRVEHRVVMEVPEPPRASDLGVDELEDIKVTSIGPNLIKEAERRGFTKEQIDSLLDDGVPPKEIMRQVFTTSPINDEYEAVWQGDGTKVKL